MAAANAPIVMQEALTVISNSFFAIVKIQWLESSPFKCCDSAFDYFCRICEFETLMIFLAYFILN